jgi:hypothetical protein
VEAVVRPRQNRPPARAATADQKLIRLLVGLLAVAMTTALLLAVNARTANAAPEITGKVRAAYGSTPPVSGATVRLWTYDGGEPGTLADTDVTSAHGNFSLVPPSSGRYFLQMVHPDFRRGWLADNKYFEPLGTSTLLVRPGDDVAKTLAIPTFVRGRVVNQANANPVEGVVVTAVEAGTHEFLARDRTNDRGVFRIEDVVPNDDSIELRFNGSDVGYESGWASCFHTVVPTSGEGCGVGLGAIGTWRIERA